MATLYIRNIPDKVYQAIKRRAKIYRRSINQETVMILEEALKGRREYILWNEIDTLRERVFKQYGSFGDSSELIRKDRER